MELNTSQPEHSIIMSKPSRNPILLIVGGIFLIAVVGLGLLVWQKNQEIGVALQQLSDSEKRFTDQEKKTQLAKPAGDLKDESLITGMALDSVEAFMSSPGMQRTTYEAKIAYLDDTFSRVIVDYTVPEGTSGKTKPSGKGEVFIFKKVKRDNNTTWALIGINPMTSDEQRSLQTRYGMPPKVLTETNQ